MTIAMLLDNPFINDRRVLREVLTLASAGHKVFLFGVKSNGLPEKEEHEGYTVIRIFGEDIYDIKKQASLRKYFMAILSVNPRVLHCHDQSMLQLGTMIKKQYPDLYLIYDSHELFHAWPLNLSKFGDPLLYIKSWIVRKYQVLREKNNAKYVDVVVTVNKSLANDLKNYFHLKNEVVVLRNIPEKQDFPVDKSLMRRRFNLPDSTRILVFIGSAIYLKTLNLEQVIDETSGIDNLALLFICGERGGKSDIMQWVKRNGYNHVYFHPLLKLEEIGPALASCDAGLVPTWNKKDLSYWYALDNKLFEYMMSGIPVLATKQPEYVAIVEAFGIGICVDPDQKDAYAKGLIQLLGNADRYKEPLQNARNILNWGNEKHQLLNMYSQILQH